MTVPSQAACPPLSCCNNFCIGIVVVADVVVGGVVEKSNNIKSTDVTQLLLFKIVFQIIIHNVRKVHPFFVNAGCWYGEAFHVDRLPPSPSFLLRVCLPM